MAALQIQCLLDENQISALTKYVSKKLYRSNRSDLEDIDKCFDTMSIRLCVEFYVDLDTIELKQAEILDEDWNLIDADSAVLRSRLKRIFEAYNYSEKELINSSKTIRKEQQFTRLNH